MPKFKITKPRFIEGRGYVPASPLAPAIIELEKAPSRDRDKDGNLVRANEWIGLFPIDDEVAPPKPHFAETDVKHPQTAAKAHGKREAI